MTSGKTGPRPATETLDWTMGRIFLFWLPLAATWLMMAAEGPFLSAVIARMADPKFNLAAYGVAFSIALLVEAPIIMIMSAASALVRDRDSFGKVKRFTYSLNVIITLIMLLILIPPVFSLIAQDLIKLPPDLARLTHISCIILLPWPGVIGYRRFYQGILIRNNRTRFVAYGTILRLAAMAGTALVLHRFYQLAGAHVGAAALSAGVTIEAVASRIMARRVVRDLISETGPARTDLSYRFITTFYLPLALTAVLALGIRPIVTFFLGMGRMPVESLAVFPVVHALTFVFSSFALSFQEVVIALAGDRFENYLVLKKFAVRLAVFVFCGLGLINFTPLAGVWFQGISGLSPDLAEFAIPPARILTIIPLLWVWLCFQRAILMIGRVTAPITKSTGLQVLLVMLSLFILINFTNLVGITAASIALLAGAAAVPLYLLPSYNRVLFRYADRSAFRNRLTSTPGLSRNSSVD